SASHAGADVSASHAGADVSASHAGADVSASHAGADVSASHAGAQNASQGSATKSPTSSELQSRRDGGALRKRDGFFFRFSFGLGPAWYSTRFKGQGHWSAYDQSVQYQLLAGGSIAEGLVVGGGATLNLMGNPRVKGRLDSANHLENVVVGQLQSFVTYYPARNLGFNLLGSIGYCVLASHFSDASWGDDAAGLTVAGGVGYQFQVSPRWSLGFQLQLSYAIAAEAGPVKVDSATVFIPAFGFATTYY
ncbi:MAG TPA: hypothetical protein VKP30_18695, partial [Polyangiaceae bacterium]|nr:hypothetical protein [Polyangiaceae bacterium]